jgi:hypothetical protein
VTVRQVGKMIKVKRTEQGISIPNRTLDEFLGGKLTQFMCAIAENRKYFSNEEKSADTKRGPLWEVEGITIKNARSFREQGIFTAVVDGTKYKVKWQVSRKGIKVDSDLSKEQLSRVFAFILQKGMKDADEFSAFIRRKVQNKQSV